MATLVNLTINGYDLIGSNFDPNRASAYLTPNTPHGLIVVDGASIRLGGKRVKFDSTGQIIFGGLIATNSADNPTSFAYRLTIVYTPVGARKPEEWTSSDFTLTTSLNFADIQEAFDGLAIAPTWQSQFRDEMELISGLTGEDAAIANRINTPGSNTDVALTARLADTQQNVVNVRRFGAVGDGVVNDTAAIQAAITEAANTGHPVYLPYGNYLVTSTITIPTSGTSTSSTVKIIGDGGGSGPYPMTTIRLSGTGVFFDLPLTRFNQEGVDVEGVAFRQVGTARTGTAFRISKTTDTYNYNRHVRFTDVSWTNLDVCVEFVGRAFDSITNPLNYFGPTFFDQCGFYDVNTGIKLNYATLNLFAVTRSLFHGCTINGAVDARDGAPFLHLRDTHFEGCEPAAFRGSTSHSSVVLDGVSSESTGDVSGYGLIDPRPGLDSNLRVYVSNSDYPFALMPTELRLPRNTQLWSSDLVSASGEGLMIHTPETVRPVVSNNASFAQSDTFSYVMTRAEKSTDYPGDPLWSTPSGTAASVGQSPASSSLPLGLRGQFVGSVNADVCDSDESFVAPFDGYIYVSWLARVGFVASAPDSQGGFGVGTVATVGGSSVGLPTGFRYKGWEGVHTLIIPILSGQSLTALKVLHAATPEWKGPAMVSYLRVDTAADKLAALASTLGPVPRRRRLKRVTLANGANVDIRELGRVANSATKVTLLLDGGASGVYTWVTRTAGSNTSRVDVDIVKSLAAGITTGAVTSPAHVQLYGMKVTNASGASVTIDAEVEYLT